MNIRELQPDVYLAIGETYESNSKVLLRGDEALVVDTTASSADAEALRTFVEKDLGKRVRFVVATHYFSDHIAGLKYFPAAEIIAHRDYRHTFDSEVFRSDEERAFFVEPHITFDDRMTLRWGRFTLELEHTPGHTMSTVAVEVPEADLLLVGDTTVGNIVYLRYSSPQLFLPALERLKRRARGGVLASHGAETCPRTLDRALHYVRELGEQVRRADFRPERIRQVPLQSCLAEGVKGTAFEEIFHQRNLEAVIERSLYA